MDDKECITCGEDSDGDLYCSETCEALNFQGDMYQDGELIKE